LSGAAISDVTISPDSHAGPLGLARAWRSRGLLGALVRRDVRLRHRQTLLGAAWALLRPAAALAVFSLLFGRVAKMPSDGLPYELFACTGLIAWTFVASAVGGAAHSVASAAPLVTAVGFPRVLLPLASFGVAALDLLVATLLLVPLLLVHDVALGAHLVLLPAALAWLALAAAGIGVPLAALVVRWRDFAHATPFLLQLGLFVTPVLWPRSALDEAWRPWAALNPLCGPVEAFRAAVLGTPLDAGGLLVSGAAGLAVLLLGFAFFQREERRLGDVV
jgi:lipopolysaccharide transport system permease protein